MEFGFEPVCDQVLAISTSWSQTGPRLVADLLARASSLLARSMIGQKAKFQLAAGLRPASDLSATSFGPVCDQDSVTEFGLK